MKTFAIVGAGAVGSYYGGRLAEVGHAVSFLLRSDYEVVRRDGLRVESIAGDFVLPEVKCSQDPAEIGAVDVVIVALKATANEHLESLVTPLLHEETIILTLQNGMGNVEALSELYGAHRVMGAMCFVCINRLEAGLISHTGGGMISLGEAVAGQSDRLTEMAEIFEGAKVKCQVVDDFSEATWRKLVWNVPFNGLCITEGGIDTAQLLAQADGESRVRALMKEVQLIASALGYEIEDDFLEHQISRTYPMRDYRPSSMLDYLSGRLVEVEAIWGKPLEAARQAGVEVPQLEALFAEISAKVSPRG